MTNRTKIGQMYDELNKDEDIGDKVMDLLCDVVTDVLQVPGIKEAILVHVLKEHIQLDEMNIHDVPFQYLWECLFDQPEDQENNHDY